MRRAGGGAKGGNSLAPPPFCFSVAGSDSAWRRRRAGERGNRDPLPLRRGGGGMRWRGMGWRGGCLAGAERGSPQPHVLFAFATGWGVWRRVPLLPLRRAEGGRGGGPLSLQAVLWRGRLGPCRGGCLGLCGPLFRPLLRRCTEVGWRGAAVLAAGFSAGFPGDFCAPFEGAFRSAGGDGCGRPFGRRYDGELGPLSGGMRCPFARRESVWAEGRGCRTGSWPAVRGGPGAVPTGGKGPVGMEGESAAPARPRRGARRRWDGVGGGWGEGAWPQLPAGGAGGGLPMEKGAAVCYND